MTKSLEQEVRVIDVSDAIHSVSLLILLSLTGKHEPLASCCHSKQLQRHA